MQTDYLPAIFTDEAVAGALDELFGIEAFQQGMTGILPEGLISQILQRYPTIKTVEQLQGQLILPVLHWIRDQSISQLTVSGLEGLDPSKRYLFISNHRDIVLDSAFMNALLYENGFTTSQVAIGDNLMKHRLSALIFKLNKSFEVRRGGTATERYQAARGLSAYIRQQIVSGRDSVWIAQREGRANDGNDLTQPGLLKMLSMSAPHATRDHFADLNLIPVSISYEFDPCDGIKTAAYLHKQTDPGYKKSFEEDTRHMLLGLLGFKGRVHFHFGACLTPRLTTLEADQPAREVLEHLAGWIDHSVHLHYRLSAVNFVASDLLSASSTHRSSYSDAEFADISANFEHKIRGFAEADKKAARAYLLGMYANPVKHYALALPCAP
jgi:glycerol-3-phosphate O-acyltransferase